MAGARYLADEPCADATPTDGIHASGTSALEASATDALAGIVTSYKATLVGTSPSALAQIYGATPVDHQVDLDEAEFDALMKKLDAMTDRRRARDHALHASARALSGYTVAPAQIQSEVTAARTGQADCLFYAMGMCKGKPSKCDRLHRRVLIKSAALSGAGVCKFFLSETGCQNSASCTFRHFALAP
ncbi:hypothetical protein M885DRAFT_559398 [Pelagophyceae sp. CCMP2097]|nr:hypothetical protein M885DRAFT_559398 [Pelagophyceae sp. CCMP2097]